MKKQIPMNQTISETIELAIDNIKKGKNIPYNRFRAETQICNLSLFDEELSHAYFKKLQEALK